jgi:hypothetical protein
MTPEPRRWNLIIIDGKEEYRYFGDPVERHRIESIMYIFGANEPKFTQSELGTRTYEFVTDRKKQMSI